MPEIRKYNSVQEALKRVTHHYVNAKSLFIVSNFVSLPMIFTYIVDKQVRVRELLNVRIPRNVT